MTYYKSLFAILLAAILVVPNASAQPEEVPPDVFEAQPGGYLYADYPGVFDDAEGDEAFGDGITVEAWVYFTGPPARPDLAPFRALDNRCQARQLLYFSRRKNSQPWY